MRRFALIIFALLLPINGMALGVDDSYPDVEDETPLSSAELEMAFKGKTHLGSYNFLHKNITSYAFEETTFADGNIRHEQQGLVDTGTWDITDDTICYDYDDPSLRQACFQIYTRGNCYYHYHVSTQGVYGPYGFTARSVIDGQIANCEPSLV